ncbi:hypothetical protein ETAA8_32940 [Anatilimnocola aggregata]|uniref:DUF2752 domain-containing protein n=1 Tax=Anatilimnocola aggregata TaxID=2528021 RepID=A0A517YD81_9BACT|nr:DUF2752 domain-containing protein [Anatilimnocola aggregata]QDU28194.1 hypothetical protein ETAA8_32940 [Anatilimnocola aggregata]
MVAIITDEAAPDESVPAQATEGEVRRFDGAIHLWLLAGSVLVIVLAATMKVHEVHEVRLPGTWFSLPELCYFRRATGLDCPGCGLTRSFISLAHGQLLAAWHFNPAGVLLFPVVLFQIPYRLAQLLRVGRGHRPWNLTTVAQGVFIALFVVLIVQWVAKFLPAW